jgi:hypothetical protein
MSEPLEEIVRHLIGDRPGPGEIQVDVGNWLTAGGPVALSAAFLVALAGPDHPAAVHARAVLASPLEDVPRDLVALFVNGLEMVHLEIGERQAADPAFARTLSGTAALLAAGGSDQQSVTEAIWAVLYPEAVGLRGHVDASVDALRRRRIVEVDEPNPRPIVDAAREVLFTSNVLLGLPLESAGGGDPVLEPAIATAVARARTGQQQYWFDHPIPIGVDPAANELLHGLRGLDAAMRAEPAVAERVAGGADGGPRRRLTCLLSVSVTHAELRSIAQRSIEEMAGIGELDHIDVLVATETDVRRLVDDVVAPAMERFRPGAARTLDELDVLGVDGEYGRHYSFLKAIAAAWQVLIDPAVRGTFKIDLDQVFPQAELVAQTGHTALQHLETELWGATGRDAEGRVVELGMIAGALVNASDIGQGLFTPDVPVRDRPSRPSEQVFFSALPQAISTRAEMMERYDGPAPDGIGTALERIHVTGGTSGILVEALRRHRPFTPSFIGRAEDQAYVLSVQGQPGPRLACAHAAGLIMRHDKEAYAGAAIEAALVGKLVGDDVRILTFSAYAAAISDGPDPDGASDGGATISSMKALLDPFTGGFISRLPVTTVLLRFALRVIEAYAAGQTEVGRSYAELGSLRLVETFRATTDRGRFRARIAAERAQWQAFYDTLDGLEAALAAGEPEALALRDRARELVDGWRLRPRADGVLRARS